MPEAHPTRQTLERFMQGDLSQHEALEVVGHLLSDCRACRQVTSEGWEKVIAGLKAVHREPAEAAESVRTVDRESPYRGALNSAIGKAVAEARRKDRDRAAASVLFHELMEHPSARRLTLVRNSHRFQTPELCELLMEKGFDCRFSDARLGVTLSELAVQLVQHLDDRTFGLEKIRDLEGRAWAYHGNALRVATDLRAAKHALRKAEKCFAQGQHEDHDKALLYRFEALLHRARREFDEAHSLQDRAIELYLRLGEELQAAYVLSDQSLGILYQDDPDRAAQGLARALEQFSEFEEEKGIVLVKHNLAFCFAQLGQLEHALDLVEEIRPLLQNEGDDLSLIRLRWLEGKIFLGLNRIELAEGILMDVRDFFVAESIGYDAALASLDLATLYAGLKRPSDVRRLAEEMLPIFQSRDVHREALAALIIFREAALAETATLTMIQQISRFLTRARNSPELRFEQS